MTLILILFDFASSLSYLVEVVILADLIEPVRLRGAEECLDMTFFSYDFVYLMYAFAT